MIRDAILKTKRDELTKCITGRKRKLQELYFATVSLAATEASFLQCNSNDGKSHNTGEATFLEANDISQNRFFNASTLPPTPTSHTNGREASKPSHPANLNVVTSKWFGSVRDKADATSNVSEQGENGFEPQDPLSRQNGDPVSAESLQHDNEQVLPASEVPSKGAQSTLTESNANINDRLDSSPQVPSFKFNSDASHSSPGDLVGMHSDLASGDIGISATVALPLSVDEVDSLSNSNIVAKLADQRPGHALTVHLPPKEVQEHHLETLNKDSIPGSCIGEGTQTEGLEREDTINEVSKSPDSLEVGADGIDRSLPSRGQDDPSVKESNTRSIEAINNKEHENLLKSQMQVAQSEAFADTRLTLDALPRLETAQYKMQSFPATNVLPDASTKPDHQGLPQPDGKSSGTPSEYVRSNAKGDRVADISVEDESSKPDQAPQMSRSVEDSHQFGPSRVPDLRDRKHPGMTRNMSKDLMFSPRPPMRIDTGGIPAPGSNGAIAASPDEPFKSKVDLSNVAGSSTPAKLVAATTPTSPPERMTTRVSSGALRHKSVSEILGETPRVASHHGERTPTEKGFDEFRKDDLISKTPILTSLVTSPDSMVSKSRLSELKDREKERSKLSTIVFTRQQPTNHSDELDPALAKSAVHQRKAFESKDYLFSLFAAQAATPPRSQTLNSLLSSAHKTLTTSNHYVDFHEQQDCRIMRRIYQLQNSNRWSLRQFKRSIEPERPKTHWDSLLDHMKWMRMDFREERKWKIIAAKNLADWCAEWIASSAERRVSLQIKPKAVTTKQRSTQEDQDADSNDEHTDLPNDIRKSSLEETPELIPSAEDDSSDAMDEDVSPLDVSRASAPAAVFSLAPEDVIFAMDKTPMSDKLLSELPLYQPWIESRKPLPYLSRASPDAAWKTPILPISKYATGKMVAHDPGPMRKKSRYDYSGLDQTDRDIDMASDSDLESLLPEQTDVALFNLEHKHIRDRIHAGHSFRPPTEYPMPSQPFFESRQSSQWTYSEDDELRRLVREYSYNWSLISSCLSSSSIFSSGPERRTPWECFERWVGLEGLPADMSKTAYFRAYHSRLEAAHRILVAQQQALQQQQSSNAPQIPMRRRTAQPVRVERRKNNKHLALVDAMKRLAKKRETTIQKQQHVASLAAMRKANEPAQPRTTMYTPQHFSRIKYERDCEAQKQREQYRQHILAQQRAALQQKVNQSSQSQTGVGASQPGRASSSGAANGSSPRLLSSIPTSQQPPNQVNQTRPLPPAQPLPNGTQINTPLPTNPQANMRNGNIPQAQMQTQAQIQNQQRISQPVGSDNMRIYMEANRVQQQQQHYLQQQRQQNHPQINGNVGNLSSPNTLGSTNSSQQNAAMLANLQSVNANASPSINGASMATVTSNSPQTPNALQPQPLSSGMVPAVNQISNQIKARNPQASPDQISRMTTESLNQYRHFQAQAAMQAAAGGSTASNTTTNIQLPPQQQAMVNGANGSPLLNSQMYAQMMRNQQSSQQSRNGANGARPPSRSATPQMPRSGSVPGGKSQSPRPVQAQMAGAQ